MPTTSHTVKTFPSARLPSASGGLPVEVALIAQLGVGAGDALIAGVSARQRAHAAFVDALDEPSARIGGVDLAKGDATSLYTFAVGAAGHPFHRHAGHRVFTAISGSTGARLRFSTASDEQMAADAAAFVRALREVIIPPDSLFTVRFGGGTWHQFVPGVPAGGSPALFAISCHTDELGGDLPADLRALVAADAADIPALTEVLPAAAVRQLAVIDPASVPATMLSLHEAPASWLARACAAVRERTGPLHVRLARWGGAGGYVALRPAAWKVEELAAPPVDSLLRTQLAGTFAHEDSFVLALEPDEFAAADASSLLADVLDGFLCNRSSTVSGMMAVRNVLVKPLRLRTSPLGCPVSSLLAEDAPARFAGRFPVLALDVAPDGRRAEVILGADDRHLRFRSSVSVRLQSGGARVMLGTRVQPLNRFGRLYLAAIDRVHRRYISPTMLRLAVEHATAAHRRASLAAVSRRPADPRGPGPLPAAR